MPSKSKLGYWDIRGAIFIFFKIIKKFLKNGTDCGVMPENLAQPLRNILKYVGEDFEDNRYAVGPPPEYNRDDWFSIKFTLGLPFPNLPYYMDDDVKITNTNAIFRYLGRKHKLDGETVKEKADCDVGLEIVMDLRNSFVQLCYGNEEKFKENRETYVKNAKAKISTMHDFLADKPFFVGPKVTVCDFHLYEMLDQHRIFEPTILDDFPKLKEYCQRFEDLPQIKEYLASDKVKATPINNSMANFK